MSGPSSDQQTGIAFGPFHLYPALRCLEREGVPVRIGSRALDILLALAEKPGIVVGKEELIARAWPNLTVEESSLRFHIRGLRKALGEWQSGERYVSNVPGRGYCLVAPTAPIPSQEAMRAPSAALAPGLPPSLARMIGRDDAVAAIAGRLKRRRFVTIWGPGGIGKTTVAVAVAHAVAEEFGGAVRFLDLGTFADPSLVTSALASALGILAQSRDPTPQIIDFLRDSRALLVLDCCEHVIAAASALAERIYVDAPKVSILATSRERLRVEGEHVVQLAHLDQPPAGEKITAARVLGFPATQLLAERIAAAGYDIEITDQDAVLMADICRKLDGVALAIELVAHCVARHGLKETSSLLDGRLQWRGRRTALPRHQTLNATLDWGYELLDETERRVFQRLAIFAGPFTLAEAEGVASDSAVSRVDVVDALEGLVEKSMIVVRHHNGHTLYRHFDITRAYAREKLVASGEWPAVARRHAAHVLAVIEAEASLDRDAPNTSGSSILGDVHAALQWSFSEAGDSDLAVNLSAAAARLFIDLSLLNECSRWCEEALRRLGGEAKQAPLAMALNAALGHSLMFTDGNGERAQTALERALTLAESLGDRPSQFRLLNRLHMYHRRSGEIFRLIPLSRRLEALAAEIGDPIAVSAALTEISVASHLEGDQRAARQTLEAALRMNLFRSVPPDHFAFHRNPSIALARCLWLQGFPEQALAMARPIVERADTLDAVSHSIALIWGSAVFKWAGDRATVDRLAERLIAHARSHSLRPYQAVGLGMQGECLLQVGRITAGLALLRRSIASLRADRYELYTTDFESALAVGLMAQGATDEALAVVDETIHRVVAMGGKYDLPELIRIRGEILAHRGDFDGAAASFGKAIPIADRQNSLSWRLRVAASAARLELRAGGDGTALAVLAETCNRFTEGFSTVDFKEAHQLLDSARASTENRGGA